ncbi:hypothetical protein F441_09266 [Phytophthora nicotianae CJ01A1]|uniref:Uncharacterized protein n=6 Tax=Phytophthora nicotianae TaxID=4792 RepID=W2Q881_PHYN3|nr:hypothetical protein PPTG_23021 [Phytophthora nicotianae INRA-310]ETI46286.1 hypothetical protein F443_09308 [Phytophthora nicotianae P1569]ETK86225.1 hypothetical protein L915_09127 [Phytophthora nicotianae]ETO59044.1 hypothetical protein F444_22577 [Phytophthora nicotianae P1976]ETP16093.1 hypothetical protein F441_09266 [Phytophthora nicotianae CJ01A1]ETP44144.1 hypothetical protein F442_09231 [Phytophthora nicotianae P10297]
MIQRSWNHHLKTPGTHQFRVGASEKQRAEDDIHVFHGSDSIFRCFRSTGRSI